MVNREIGSEVGRQVETKEERKWLARGGGLGEREKRQVRAEGRQVRREKKRVGGEGRQMGKREREGDRNG